MSIFDIFKKNKNTKTYEEQLNELMLQANNSRDKALIGIALQARRLSDRMYMLADPLNQYSKNNPEKLLDYLIEMEKELDVFLGELKRGEDDGQS